MKSLNIIFTKIRIFITFILLVFLCLVASEIILGKGIPFISKQNKWSIGIYSGNSPYNLSSDPNSLNPVLSSEDVTDVPAIFVADPFMIKDNGNWYMFFEILNAKTRQGDIGLASSKDGYNWKYIKVVLDESFHLSYPYVFKWEGQYYMVPETAKAGSVRLYRASDFPAKWKLVGNLLDGRHVDPSLFNYENRWWMFVGDANGANDTLRLFYAADLMGTWIEHPQSPIIKKDARISRPGGRVIVYDGKIIRFTQDDQGTYGNKINAYEVTELTITDYSEKEIGDNPILNPTGNGWNKDGMHHVDLHKINKNKWLACVDGHRRNWVVSPLFKRK